MRDEDFEYWYEVGCDAINYGDPGFGYHVIERLRDEIAVRGLDGLPERAEVS